MTNAVHRRRRRQRRQCSASRLSNGNHKINQTSRRVALDHEAHHNGANNDDEDDDDGYDVDDVVDGGESGQMLIKQSAFNKTTVKTAYRLTRLEIVILSGKTLIIMEIG